MTIKEGFSYELIGTDDQGRQIVEINYQKESGSLVVATFHLVVNGDKTLEERLIVSAPQYFSGSISE
jgi:hypothetical protein